MDAEYPIDAARFTRALREQREIRMPGGLYHLTQIQLAYNTNRIEGSRLSEEQTRHIYETRTISGDANVDDIIETQNHFRLFDEMLDHLGDPIDADTIKTYHRTLKSGTAAAEHDWFAVGDWKRLANVVGGSPTTPPDLVETAMHELLARTPDRMSFDDICDFHHRFESIHPFQDGNGRVGRLIMFEQCLANDIMPFIVLDEQKHFYYRGLANYEQKPGFLREAFRNFQDAYYETHRQYVHLADRPSAAD